LKPAASKAKTSAIAALLGVYSFCRKMTDHLLQGCHNFQPENGGEIEPDTARWG
jgi:hypothetical protein